MEHRIVSILPLSHLLEQSVGLFYALSVGADILYVRSRNPRVIFDALRAHRVTSMIVVPQLLDLFWSQIEREVAKRGRTAGFDRLRAIGRHLPARIRRWLFRNVHAQLGGQFRLFVSAGAFLPPAVQQGWEDLGVTVLQGYGTTETGTGSCTTLEDHGLGTVGRPPAGIEMRLAADGEVQFRGPTLFKGYWRDPDATAAAFTEDGWYRTGDIGHLDPAGRLVLSGRSKDMIVLPNGFNVYPEDIENALRIAGLRDSVVVETRPGRIEAVVLGGGCAAGVGRCRGVAPERDRRDGQGGQRALGSEPAYRRAGACGPRRTSRARTRTRSSARRSAPGRSPTPPGRSSGPIAAADAAAAPRAGQGLAADREPDPQGLERLLDPGRRRILGRARQPVVEDHRRADLAQDLDRALGRLDPAGPVSR